MQTSTFFLWRRSYMERFAWNEFYGSHSVFRSSLPEVFWKKDVLRNLTKFTGKHLCQSLFFNKVARLETLAQVFSREFSQISRNIFLHRAPLVAASGFSRLRTSYTVRFPGFAWYNSMTQYIVMQTCLLKFLDLYCNWN